MLKTTSEACRVKQKRSIPEDVNFAYLFTTKSDCHFCRYLGVQKVKNLVQSYENHPNNQIFAKHFLPK